MSFLHTLAGLFRKEIEPDPEALAAAERVKAHFRERCIHFRRLLSANKAALEAMAEMEERLHSGRPFGMSVVRGLCTRAGTNVFQMIRHLNALSDNRYPSLGESFSRVSADIEETLAYRAGESPSLKNGSPLVLPLSDIGLADIHEVGGKMANLGEVFRYAGLPVPDGFAITAEAYYHFIQSNSLQEEIDRRIQATDADSLDAVFTLSASLQQLIQSAPLPEDLEKSIDEQVARMQKRAGPGLRLALRSSAVGEDALGASFAGQYHSELNVHPDEAPDVWREVIASKYAVTAMTYRYQRGIPDAAVPMCVGVLAMVDAVAGGVAYSRNPMDRDTSTVVINAVPGLPKAVVDGSFSPDTFVLSREHPPQVLERRIAVKPFRFICDPDQGVQRVPLTEEESSRPCIDDDMARTLTQLTLALEEYYEEPQDVEWAVAADGRVIILQSRPLKEAESPFLPPQDASPAGLTSLLSGGTPVSPGVGAGAVFVARKDADILAFPKGGVLVVERAQPRWATLLSRASAVVAEAGGTAGHLASVAREYGVPAIFGLPDAIATLEQAGEITVDADHARIYPDRHLELVPVAPRKNLMEGSPVYETLRAVSRHIVPLNLLDPASYEFAPEHCRTLHDITRFCHEKSVELMFGEEDGFETSHGKQLKAGVKLQYWIIDIDDGFIKPVAGPVVELSNIRSAPMLALWKGMTAVPWTGPPATDAAGFMSVVFESAMNRDLEATTASALTNRNFLMISSTFMNLQARFGYHFCTVESQAGKDAHENYVSFQFKGGAASQERRVLRARMVGELLEEYGFRIEVREDALFATAEGFSAKETLMCTTLLGYLLIHTRQVDMIMQHEAQAAALRRKLATDMAMLAQSQEATEV